MLLYLMFSVLVVGIAGYECPGGRLTAKQRREIVDQNNKFRAELISGKLKNMHGYPMPRGKNMMKLEWDCNLEYSAQRWADRCYFGHSHKSERPNIGENIFTLLSYGGTAAEFAETAGTTAGEKWWEELQTKYPHNPSNMMGDHIPDGALHFTQMAWGQTEKIGCGITSTCQGGRRIMVVCHYTPHGNMNGQLIYELGEPCKSYKDCSSMSCSTSTGLCIARNGQPTVAPQFVTPKPQPVTPKPQPVTRGPRPVTPVKPEPRCVPQPETPKTAPDTLPPCVPEQPPKCTP